MRKALVAVVVLVAVAGCNTIPRTIRGIGTLATEIGTGLYLDGNAAVMAVGGMSLFGGRRTEKEERDGAQGDIGLVRGP